MSEPRQSTYNFISQMNLLQDICQTNIILAEQSNALIKNISPDLLKSVTKELKLQYEEKYFKTNKPLFSSIVRILNTVRFQGVNYMDYLFMQFGIQLNAYYAHKYLNLRKTKHYTLYCKYCLRYVSNDAFHLRHHESYCPKNGRKRFRKGKLVKSEQPMGHNPLQIRPTFKIGSCLIKQSYVQSGPAYIQGSQNFDHFGMDMVVIREEDDNLVHVIGAQSDAVKQEEGEGKRQEQIQAQIEEQIIVKMEELSSNNMRQGPQRFENDSPGVEEVEPPAKHKKMIFIKQDL